MNLSNKLTVTRLLLAPLFLFSFLYGNSYGRLFATLIIIIAAITDMLDGKIARKRGEITLFGKAVDPIADAIFFVTVFVCIAAHNWAPYWLVYLIVLREVFMSMYLRPILILRKADVAAKMHGKIKTVVQSIVGIVLIFTSAIISPDYPWIKIVSTAIMLPVAALSLGSLKPYIEATLSDKS